MSPTDEQLLSGYTAGRRDQFELLVRRYSQELFHCVYRMVGSSAAAEDVVQETFLQVHVSATRFDPSRRFRPWVFTIAVNKARDALRVRQRQRETSLDHTTATGDDDARSFGELLSGPEQRPTIDMEIEERSARVRALVGHMPEHLREVLILAYYHGFAYRDMADILDIPLGTIKSRLHAAVKAFAKAHDTGHAETLEVTNEA